MLSTKSVQTALGIVALSAPAAVLTGCYRDPTVPQGQVAVGYSPKGMVEVTTEGQSYDPKHAHLFQPGKELKIQTTLIYIPSKIGEMIQSAQSRKLVDFMPVAGDFTATHRVDTYQIPVTIQISLPATAEQMREFFVYGKSYAGSRLFDVSNSMNPHDIVRASAFRSLQENSKALPEMPNTEIAQTISGSITETLKVKVLSIDVGEVRKATMGRDDFRAAETQWAQNHEDK